MPQGHVQPPMRYARIIPDRPAEADQESGSTGEPGYAINPAHRATARPGLESCTEFGRLKSFGIHCIAELYECPPALLDDEAHVKKSLREAVEYGFASLLHEVSHKFTPQGVTALALIAESHVAIHTWPEYGYIAADAFTCGDEANAEKAVEYLIRAFKAGRHSIRTLNRGDGQFDGPAVPRQEVTDAHEALASSAT